MAEKSEKLSQKELKEPDAFQEAGLQAQSWVAEHGKLLLMIIGAVVAVGLIASLVSLFSSRSSRQASTALSGSLLVLTRPVQTEGETAPNTAADEKPFATQAEKEEAVRTALTKLRNEHSGTEAARNAALPLAQTELQAGNADAAIALYDEFLKGAPKNEPLRAVALEGRGYALEAKGDLPGATAAFESLARESTGPMLAGMGNYHHGRLLMQQNKLDEAAAILVPIPVNHSGTAAARLAAERIEELTAKGVKLPAAPTKTPPTQPAAE